jgi:hypothetical protein
MARDIDSKLDQLRELLDSGAMSEEEYRKARDVLKGKSGRGGDAYGADDAEPRPKRSGKRSVGRTAKQHEAQGPHGDRSSPKGVYRDGGKLVVREGTQLPDRCVICNKECDGAPMRFTFGRLWMGYVELAAIQTVANAASDLVTGTRYSGPVHTEIPLCPWHRRRRLRRLGAGLGILAIAAAYLFIRYSIGGAAEFSIFRMPILNIIVILVGIVGIAFILHAVFDRTRVWFRAAKYYDRFVWLKGAGKSFLRTLPQLEAHHYKPGRDSDNPDLTADELIRRGKLGDE